MTRAPLERTLPPIAPAPGNRPSSGYVFGMTDRWDIEARVVGLELAEPFKIARALWTEARNVFVLVRYGDQFGVGEVSPDEHWGETPESVLEQISKVDPSEARGPFDLEWISDQLPPGSARCAMDIALHDLAGKLAGIPVRALIGVGDRALPPTSMTVPIADVDTMVARARSLADFPIIKTKVGFDGDVDAIAAIRGVFKGRLRIDANEGWSADEAIERLNELHRFDIELCEQPIPKGDIDGLFAVTGASPIPVYADEDAGSSSDVAALAGSVHGVNLKLRKAGGIREAVRAVHVARAHGLGVMLGCDLVSGVATSAEVQMAPLADFIDLDGPTLLARDPHPCVTYDKGSITAPVGPGLGLSSTPW